MKTALLVLVLGVLVAMSATAEITESGSGIIYGKDHAFSLTAPKGWMLDNESAVEQGVHAVFYPKGKTWSNSDVVAYAQARPRGGKILTADDAAKNVVEDFHANGNPKYESKRIKTLRLDKGREAVIYHFQGDQWGNNEAAAYVVEDKTINYVVLTARSARSFKEALPAFEELVKSYAFVGDKASAAGVSEPGR